MKKVEQALHRQLMAMQDEKYKQFNCKLIPNVPPEKCIGIRTPQLRKFAKEYSKSPDCEKFMRILPHNYYEEDNLHGMLISLEKDVQKTYRLLDEFLPYINNWATCDIINPICFKKHPQDLTHKARQWMASDHTYTIRFGIGTLMSHYLDSEFKADYPDWVAICEKRRVLRQYDDCMVFCNGTGKAVQRCTAIYRKPQTVSMDT